MSGLNANVAGSPANGAAIELWLSALNLDDANITEFLFGEDMGSLPDQVFLVDSVRITGISEGQISARVNLVLQTRAHELPVDSNFLIRAEDFELLISINGREPRLLWPRGAHSRAIIESGLPQNNAPPRGTHASNATVNSQEILEFWMRALRDFTPTSGLVPHPGYGQLVVIRIPNAHGLQMLVRIRDVLAAVEHGDAQLPPGGHILPCSIATEDGAHRFAPPEWDDPYQAAARGFSKNRRPDTPAPVHLIPSDDSSTAVDQLDNHSDTSSSSGRDAEYQTPENIPNIPRPVDLDLGNGPSPPAHGNSGGPPPWERPPWATDLPNHPAGPQNAPPPNSGLPWVGAIPTPQQAPQMPVVFPRHRTAHIPFLPPHKWGTSYGPRRSMAPRIPQLPMMAPPAPLQFFMPPPIQGQNPLNPDLAGPINWRVFLPPSTARMPRSRTGPLLQAPATSPPCFCVAITFEDPSLMHWVQRWGPIRVPVHSRTVTVGDVPDAIYEYASQPLTPADLAFVVPQDKVKMDESGRLRQMQGYPYVRPVPLRSDVFNNSVMFGGLSFISMSGQGAYLSLRLFSDW